MTNILGRLTIIQGKAGTGKSCLINEMVYDINSYFTGSCILLTGVAANNINGATPLILNNNIKATPFCFKNTCVEEQCNGTEQ